jgi:hypothetical protein
MPSAFATLRNAWRLIHGSPRSTLPTWIGRGALLLLLLVGLQVIAQFKPVLGGFEVALVVTLKRLAHSARLWRIAGGLGERGIRLAIPR